MKLHVCLCLCMVVVLCATVLTSLLSHLPLRTFNLYVIRRSVMREKKKESTSCRKNLKQKNCVPLFFSFFPSVSLRSTLDKRSETGGSSPLQHVSHKKGMDLKSTLVRKHNVIGREPGHHCKMIMKWPSCLDIALFRIFGKAEKNACLINNFEEHCTFFVCMLCRPRSKLLPRLLVFVTTKITKTM